ncbi:MAG: hypothetical protein ACR2FI_03170 [Burkholderiales bacterium]
MKLKPIVIALFAIAGSALPLQVAVAQNASSETDEERETRQSQAAGEKRELRRFARRGDIRELPAPLKSRLIDLAKRPHSYLPITAFSEAVGDDGTGDKPSQLFQYYLLDTNNFQPNVFTTVIPGINDTAIRTAANAANGGLPSIGAVRVTLEPKPGLPTDPNDVGAFIDTFTDISGLFVINNESGWYEGWMIRDIRVPKIAPPRADGSAQYFTMTQADADAIRALGPNNVPGKIFTLDGQQPRFGSATDVFPDPALQPNIVPFPVSIGTFNSQQQSDIHAYWEFNPGTNWVFPHYELPGTGGVPTTFAGGLQYGLQFQSLIAGDGPPSPAADNDKLVYGDNPDDPRDPDRTEAGNPADLEFRNRFIPSGLTEELLLNVFVRVTSFLPGTPPNSPANIGSAARVVCAGNRARRKTECRSKRTTSGQGGWRHFIRRSEHRWHFGWRTLESALVSARHRVQSLCRHARN